MIDNSVLKIDGKTYLVIDKIESDDCKYIYFGNENDEKDLFVRKELKNEDKTLLVGLDDEQEFLKSMELFKEKNK